MEKETFKNSIYFCMENMLKVKKKEYLTLEEIYNEVANYLEKENNATFQSQIRGRLQENCPQSSNFKGNPLFYTKSIHSGLWTIIKKKKYIRDKDNKYLVTEDDWKTVVQTEKIGYDYQCDKDTDNIYKGKLIANLGKEKAQVILEELEKIKKILIDNNVFSEGKLNYGNAFEVFAISTLHNISYESCIKKYLVKGSNDGKIDAIYYDNNRVDVYQIKVGDIKPEDKNLLEANYDLCQRHQTPKDGEDLFRFIEKNREFLKGKTVLFHIISSYIKNSEINKTPNEIYKMFFENKLLPTKTNNLKLEILKPKKYNNEVYQNNVSKDENNNFIFYIRADEFIECLLRSLGISSLNSQEIDLSKYFNDNVRGKLKVNKKIQYTIKNEPENFVKYNNGINITGNVEDLTNAILITDPIINNGQQTITTLIETKKNLDKIILPIKITNENNMEIKAKISQYTNEQVKVKAVDILSLNSEIRLIQQLLYKNNQYFLEIYTSGKKGYNEIIKKIYPKNNIIKLLDFLKLYFSVENPKQLGNWKNNPNNVLEEININKPFDLNQSLKICKAISDYKNYINQVENKKEKADLKSADLAFMYLLVSENMNPENANIIIKNINNKYYYSIQDKKSKLIDIYKSSSIINKILEEIKHQKYTEPVNK